MAKHLVYRATTGGWIHERAGPPSSGGGWAQQQVKLIELDKVIKSVSANSHLFMDRTGIELATSVGIGILREEDVVGVCTLIFLLIVVRCG